jgi:ferredoxin
MTTFQVHLINKKRNIDITIPVDDDTYIIDAAEENDIELPFSCRSGQGGFIQVKKKCSGSDSPNL